jgi:hypothetical protein
VFASEDGFYKSLLREVIEARAAGTGGASGIDVGQLRSEKKKKRDAERGASKGRKLRYVFVIPHCVWILRENRLRLLQIHRARKSTELYRPHPT